MNPIITTPTEKNPITFDAVARTWQLRPVAPAEFIRQLTELGYSPLTAQLLYNRELTSPESIEYYFKADYQWLADPFLIKDMDRAVERIIRAVRGPERLAIYGDFDADGVTACSLLVQFFRATGADVIPRIPHRVDEGYGLNPSALRRLADQGVNLVITVDCGISNVDEVELAGELGMDVIITDHHRPPERLPVAYATLNVRQPGDQYPYKGLAGVGVAFHLVRALTQAGLKPAAALRPRDLLDLVALGTVADVAPLTGENRVLVTAGLKALNNTRRPGIVALIEAAGLTPGQLDTSSIGFGLAPRINAAGRIDDAIIAYDLLLTDDLEKARTLAHELTGKNRERQQKLATVLEEARRQVYEGQLHQKHKLIVLSGAEWPAGIVGLVAGRLTEEFNRPVLVLERGPETSRGSARSTAQFNIIEAITDCHDLLLRYGGHKQAAGFSLVTPNLAEFAHRLQTLADDRLQSDKLVPQIDIDLALRIDQLPEARKVCLELEPFGSENTAPVFISYGLQIREIRPVGADGAHLKLKFFDPKSGRLVQAIAFRAGPRIAELSQARRVDVVYVLEENEWQGNRSLQLRVLDLKVANAPLVTPPGTPG